MMLDYDMKRKAWLDWVMATEPMKRTTAGEARLIGWNEI